MAVPEILGRCTGFDWDAGNADQNWELHRVSRAESERVFFSRPVLIAVDERHSTQETRYAALGRTDGGRLLAVVFTIRGTLIRVISARDMSLRERRVYEGAREGGHEAKA